MSMPTLTSSSYYAYVAWLEKHDPEIRSLSEQLRYADELGYDTDGINEHFNAAVEERLKNVAAICVACAATGNVVRGIELAMSNPSVGPIHHECVQARQRASVSGKCSCPRGKRRRSDLHEPHGSRGRAFVSCLRCLGVVEQVR